MYDTNLVSVMYQGFCKLLKETFCGTMGDNSVTSIGLFNTKWDMPLIINGQLQLCVTVLYCFSQYHDDLSQLLTTSIISQISSLYKVIIFLH